VTVAVPRDRVALVPVEVVPDRVELLPVPVVEGAQLGFGVDGISLHAIRTSPIAHEQVETVETAHAGNEDSALGELIDSYISRLGAERVLRFDSVEAHVPEHRYLGRSCIAPPRLAATRKRSAAVRPSINRPSILFRPQSITITTNESGIPTQIQYHSDHRILVTAIGPERITPEWWRSRASLSSRAMGRDYYRVQDDAGRWLWIYREIESNRWFLHGLWA
jgi:protein ImuB